MGINPKSWEYALVPLHLVCCTAVSRCKASWLCFIAGSVAAVVFLSQKDLPTAGGQEKFWVCTWQGKKRKKSASSKLLPFCGVVPSPEHHTATWESEKSSGASTPGGEKPLWFLYLSSRPRGASKTKQMGNQHTEKSDSSPEWSCGAEVEPLVRPSAVFWPLLGQLFLRMITAC